MANKISEVTLLAFLAAHSYAATINASSCSRADVNTAIGTASDGDTVQIPSCGSTTWTSGVAVSNKAIRLEGGGIGSTTINLSGGIVMVSMSGTSAGNNVASIGGMTITGSGDDNGFIRVTGTYRFRIHHLAIGDVSNRAIYIEGPYGLIDHCQFTTGSGYNAIQILGSQFAPSGRWEEPMFWENQDMVYIEDNSFVATSCVNSLGNFDGFNGSKLAFRYNTSTNWSSYNHGFDSASESALQTNIYRNTLAMSAADCPIPRYFWIRGGTGVVHNNTLSETQAHSSYSAVMISAYYYRSESSQQGQGICNGSQGVDQNTSGQSGWLCFQQPGAGGGVAVATTDPWGLSTPWYEWNNVGTGNMPADQDMGTGGVTHIQLGRDVMNDTERPGYSEYTYPHPLGGGSGGGATTSSRSGGGMRVTGRIQ